MTRQVVHYELPFSKGIKVLHPELAVIRFGNAGALDLGALCFLKRFPADVGHSVGQRPVMLDSLDVQRSHQIRSLIDHLSEEFCNGARRATSLVGAIYAFMRFIDWCDENSHSECLSSFISCRAAFSSYVHHLRQRVMQNTIKPNTAKGYQNGALDILNGYLVGDGLIHQGIALLKADKNSVESVQPPTEENQAKVLSLCEVLFNGLSDLVIDEKHYPFQLKMPHYLGWSDNSVWIFPTARWWMPPDIPEIQRSALSKPAWAYNYKEGRISSIREIQK